MQVACYVDLVLVDANARLDFTKHEQLAIELGELLNMCQISLQCRIVIRGAISIPKTRKTQAEDGFAVTLFLSGYGMEMPSARKSWAIALKLVENALRQMSAKHTRRTLEERTTVSPPTAIRAVL